jgi:hypothetical protein
VSVAELSVSHLGLLTTLLPDTPTLTAPLTVSLGWRPHVAARLKGNPARSALWAGAPSLPTPYYADELVTLYCGDVRDILPRLSEDVADVLVTDPPYGIAHASGRRGVARWHGRQIPGDEDTGVRDDVLAWWGDKPALVFGSWKRPAPPNARATLVWDKWPLGSGDLALPWRPNHEEIYVLGRGFDATRRRTSGVIRCAPVQARASSGRRHQHQKPLGLMYELVGKTVGTVLDPFAGSGSTLVAAAHLGRPSVGIEIDPAHCAGIVERLQAPRPLIVPIPAARDGQARPGEHPDAGAA